MPLSRYYGGHGEKVMRRMKKQYGAEKGKQVFYATANKKKKSRDGRERHPKSHGFGRL